MKKYISYALLLYFVDWCCLYIRCCYILPLVLNCFCLTKGRSTHFRPETIVASFLHLMVILIPDKWSCYEFSTRNNCCEFLAFYGVIVQSVIQSYLKMLVRGASSSYLNQQIEITTKTKHKTNQLLQYSLLDCNHQYIREKWVFFSFFLNCLYTQTVAQNIKYSSLTTQSLHNINMQNNCIHTGNNKLI